MEFYIFVFEITFWILSLHFGLYFVHYIQIASNSFLLPFCETFHEISALQISKNMLYLPHSYQTISCMNRILTMERRAL